MYYYAMVNVQTGVVYAYLISRKDLDGVIYKNHDGKFTLVKA